LTINVDGVGKSAAFAVSLLIRSTRDNSAVATGIRIPPGNRGAGLASLEGIHLCLVGALLVFVVKRRADSVADQTTEHATDRRAGQAVSRPAASDRRANQRTGTRSDYSAGALPRPRCGHRTRRWRVWARDTGAKGKTDDCKDDELGRVHIESILK
jgi:hypothetical protein